MTQTDSPHYALEALNQAVVLHQAGDLDGAEARYRELLSREPEQPDAWNLLGLLAHQRGAHETALAMIGHAIALNPRSATYRVNLAEAAHSLGQFSLATATLKTAIELEPVLPMPRSNLANLLYELDRHDEAMEQILNALELDPRSARAWGILGNIHEAISVHQGAQGAEQRRQAHAAYRKAIGLDPTFAMAHANLALSLDHAGQFDEASAAYARALELDPLAADIHWNRAHMLLTLGEFEEGWMEYEWRWQRPAFTSPRRGFPQPLWKGQELSGKRILVYAEQGFGDAIQFVRYTTLLAARGAEVFVDCPRELVRLFESVPGAAQVITSGDPLPEVDFQAPFMSLPLGFHTTLQTVPASTPYLAPDPAIREKMRRKLEAIPSLELGGVPQSRKTVGIIWAGRPTPKGFNANRSMTLKDFGPVLGTPDCRFVSLQKGPGAEEVRESGLPVIDLMDEVQDFADLAALMSLMDLVISVDTAAAHLAGALGLPTWTLVPMPGAFQWLRDREDSPWYPTMRLFRQPAIGDWAAPVARISEALCITPAAL
jgi:Flp pilus assembly protein TadD